MPDASLFPESFLRRLEALALLYRQSARSLMQGERRSSQRGQSVEFSDYRPYTPGDDFRRIDWNAYARMERLFLKLFVEEVEVQVRLLIDNSRSMRFGEPSKHDLAIRLAGALGFVALSGLDRVSAESLGGNDSGSSPAHRLNNLRGKRNAPILFRFLQTIRCESQSKTGEGARKSPSAALAYYAANANQPGPLILFSDLMDEGYEFGLNRLAGKGFEITLLHILSSEEIDPILEGDFKLVDSETGAEIEISANFDTLDRYRKLLSTWQEGWRSYCASRGIHYLPVSTTESLESLLFAGLPQQGVLR